MNDKNIKTSKYITLQYRLAAEEFTDRLIDYLFGMDSSETAANVNELNLTANKSGKIKFKEASKQKFIDELEDFRNSTDFTKNELGSSVYVTIDKDGKSYLQIRISYHAPDIKFGTGKSLKDCKGFLCIDALSKRDNDKIIKYKKDKLKNKGKPEEYIENEFKEDPLEFDEKMKHKNKVENELEIKAKYMDLGKDDFNSVFKCIESFIKSFSMAIFENLNSKDFDKFDVYFEFNED